MQLWQLRQRVHVSWCIAVCSLFFVVGVWTAQLITLHVWWVIVASCVGVIGFIGRRVYMLGCIAAAGTLAGICYGSTILAGLNVYAPFVGDDVIVTGRIREDPSITKKGLVVFQLDTIHIGGRLLPGTVWTSILGHPNAKRGEIVTVSGKASEGFGTYALGIFTAQLITVTHPVPGDVGRVVRDWFADAIRKAIKEPQASLGIGYLTGQKSALPPDLSQALQIAGLSHVVVASGYNLTILVRLSRRFFMKISKFVSLFASLLMIAGFVAMTGLSPSMTRAGLVASLSLLTWYYGRQFHPFVLLPFAAAMTVIFQPSYAWGDVGWQLSFAAFAAVMIVGPLLQHYFFGQEEPGIIRQVLGETVAAHVVTIPIVVPAFSLISNIAIPANILIVPLVPLAMLLTFIAGMCGLLVPQMAAIVGLPAQWLLTYMTSIAQYLAALPWAQTIFHPRWWMVLLYIFLLVAVCIYMQKATGFKLREVNSVE